LQDFADAYCELNGLKRIIIGTRTINGPEDPGEAFKDKILELHYYREKLEGRNPLTARITFDKERLAEKDLPLEHELCVLIHELTHYRQAALFACGDKEKLKGFAQSDEAATALEDYAKKYRTSIKLIQLAYDEYYNKYVYECREKDADCSDNKHHYYYKAGTAEFHARLAERFCIDRLCHKWKNGPPATLLRIMAKGVNDDCLETRQAVPDAEQPKKYVTYAHFRS
jgi:hypothetical protein